MKKFQFFAALVCVCLSGSAFAGSITYGVTGVFSGTDCQPTICSNGSADVMYFGQVLYPVPEGSENLGYFRWTNRSLGNPIGTFGGNDQIALTITETGPDAGSATVTGFLSGQVVNNISTLVLTFSTTTFNIGSTIFTLQPTNQLSGSNGFKNIYANISIVTTPEPASLGLVGLGLAGLFLTCQRKLFRLDGASV